MKRVNVYYHVLCGKKGMCHILRFPTLFMLSTLVLFFFPGTFFKDDISSIFGYLPSLQASKHTIFLNTPRKLNFWFLLHVRYRGNINAITENTTFLFWIINQGTVVGIKILKRNIRLEINKDAIQYHSVYFEMGSGLCMQINVSNVEMQLSTILILLLTSIDLSATCEWLLFSAIPECSQWWSI